MTAQVKGVREAIGLATFEGAGITAIAILGAEFMLAPAGNSLSSVQSLAPGLVAGLGAGLYRFSQYAPRSKPAEHRRLAEPARTRGAPLTRLGSAAGPGLAVDLVVEVPSQMASRVHARGEQALHPEAEYRPCGGKGAHTRPFVDRIGHTCPKNE